MGFSKAAPLECIVLFILNFPFGIFSPPWAGDSSCSFALTQKNQKVKTAEK
jgi:hypothetical protein